MLCYIMSRGDTPSDAADCHRTAVRELQAVESRCGTVIDAVDVNSSGGQRRMPLNAESRRMTFTGREQSFTSGGEPL